MTRDFIDLPLTAADAIQTVATVADLPSEGVMAGSILYVEDDDTLYTYNGASWDAVGSGGGGSIPGANNQMVWKNPSGTVETFTGWGFDTATSGARWTLETDVIDDGGGQLHSWNAQFNPSEASPDANWQFRSVLLDVDGASSGFAFGTNGNALEGESLNIRHLGTSDSGALSMRSGSFTIGNGTDPIDVNGFSYSYGFGQVAAGVTISGPIQGYGIQPTLDAAAICDPSAYFSGFYDTTTVAGTWAGSWQSFNSSPGINEISGPVNYVGVNINPTITDINGNAGVNGVAVGGTYGTFASGSYFNGVMVNPTITAGQNVVLLAAYNDNVTASGTVKAIDVRGDVSITGDLELTGGFNYNGALNLFSPYTIVANPSPGQVSSLFSFVSGPTCAANSTIANADFLGVNTASLIDIGDNSTITTALTGLSALGLPAVAKIGAGASVDKIAGATFALSLDATAGAGGLIDTVALGQALATPNGITTVNRIYGWYADLPSGAVGTLQYGLYATAAFGLNWVGGKFKIGGGDEPTNSDCALEVSGGAVVLPNMDTLTRDAMTAIPGMLIFNTDTTAMEYYNGAAWV